jgi:hypothetical protein
MLNLNAQVGASGTADEEVYKVLILDRFCRDIISPLLRVSDLRKHGITLHLMVDQERQSIPDAPAVYFVQPTPPNVQRILQDLARGVYDNVHLNFVSSLPRPLLEELASACIKTESLHRIAKVYDQYLEFVALDSTMFSLAQPLAYLQLNDPTAQDKDVEAAVEAIVSGLFSVLATLGVVPVIRCPQGGPAEMVATQLDARLRDHLVSRNNLFSEPSQLASSFQRPLLCLFDRNFELGVAVQHVFTYRPLVHDVLGLKLNRVVVNAEPGAAGGVPTLGRKPQKSFELDEGDPFWVANGGATFPKVAEEVEVQLAKYKKDIEEVNKRTSGQPVGEITEDDLAGNTRHLMAAVGSLPELTERKRNIDKHTNIATALLHDIRDRGIDTFYLAEEEMAAKGTAERTALLAAINGKGKPEDKVRLAIMFLLTTEQTPAGDLEAVEAALTSQGADLAPLHYVRKLKSLNVQLASAHAGSKGNLLDWADKLYGQSISAVTAGVKNLLSSGRQLALTRAVEALMESKPGPETEQYLFLDPRGPKGGGSEAASRNRGPFKEAIVFMVGGGNYLEHQGLQELASKSQPPKNVVYGATEILTATEFLGQLSELGRKMAAGTSGAVSLV